MPARLLRTARPTRADVRATVALALPVTTVQVGMMLMGVVDAMMVGRISAEALAAVAIGNLYFFTLAVFGMGILMSLDPVVSQAVGAGDRSGIARAVQRGLVIAAAVSTVVSLLLVPGEQLLTLIRQPAEVVPTAAGYARASILGVAPFFAFAVFRQTLQAMGIVRPIVVVIVAANALNALLNWMLVFGKLGAPALGPVGSGWASSLSRLAMAAGLLALGWRALRPALRPLRRDALAWRPFTRMLRIGVPIGIQHQLEMGAFGLVAVLMGWFGATEVAAHHVAINLASLTFMVPLGIAAAGAVLVGQAVGRGDEAAARRAAATAVLGGFGVMTLSAVLFLTLPGPLARLYTDDLPAIALAVTLIPIAGVFQVFDGVQVVSSGVLRGVGDTRAPLAINLFGFWFIGLPVSLLAAFTFGMGPVGLWWGLVAGLMVVAVALLVRLRVRFRRPLARLQLDDHGLTRTDEFATALTLPSATRASGE